MQKLLHNASEVLLVGSYLFGPPLEVVFTCTEGQLKRAWESKKISLFSMFSIFSGLRRKCNPTVKNIGLEFRNTES